ncbi:MAG TPA: hypothetical protein VKU94_05240 [Geobacterales bacterium]|nr:hypothetical protein [Geobacterales bacterium]
MQRLSPVLELPNKKYFLLLIGCSFKTSSIEYREKLAMLLNRAEIRKQLNSIFHSKESTFISTCNRCELVLVTDNPDRSFHDFISFLDLNHLPINGIYRYQDFEVIKHLLLVSCGLDSAALFEEQIQEQLRRINIQERVINNSRAILSQLFDFCYNAAKRIRKSVNLPNGVSLALASVEYLHKLGYKPKKVLLIGSGKMIQLFLKHFDLKNVETLFIYTRRDNLPKVFSKLQRVSPDLLPTVANVCDLIISSTNNEGYIITKNMLQDSDKIIIDLGFPRNIDPEIRSMGRVKLIDLDELARFSDHDLSGFKYIIEQIDSEAKRFYNNLYTAKLNKIIPSIYIWAEEIRKYELGRALKELKSENIEDILEAMSKSIVNKLLSPINKFAKEDPANIEILYDIFKENLELYEE